VKLFQFLNLGAQVVGVFLSSLAVHRRTVRLLKWVLLAGLIVFGSGETPLVSATDDPSRQRRRGRERLSAWRATGSVQLREAIEAANTKCNG